ncbi:MAG: HIRAN domain-containing protein [Planctomycetaceae bacterium]|jgi:hypothetical protein|nr:HIRAN domain-containing protein [Planctomycetaceae bacterium]
MKTLDDLFLVWRRGRGERRSIVGVVEEENGNFQFKYLIKPEEAAKIGFTPYVAFSDMKKVHTENVLDTFALRLTNPARQDIQKYYDFWEIEPEHQKDKWYLLARTQGIRAIDNFELLADYHVTKDLMFFSEICGLSYYRKHIPLNAISESDELRWEKDTDNEYDKYAVKVFKGDLFLGFVKVIHSRVFYKDGGQDIKIKIKSIDKNGTLNRVFIKIYNHDVQGT